MRDFRFHIASLIAVFLALGVGMLVGYSIGLELQMEPLRSQIQSVQKQNSELSDENRDLQDSGRDLGQDKTHLQNEVDQLARLSVAGRLAGRSVSLICVGAPPPPSVVDHIWKPLLAAGATRLNETSIHGPIVPPNSKAANEILTHIQAASDDDPSTAIARALALCAGLGSDPVLPTALSHRGTPIDFSGTYDKKADLVVLLSGVDSEDRLRAIKNGDTLETPIVQALQDHGVRVVECEENRSFGSAGPYFHRLGISSVDDIESVEGEVALVWAALGYSGHYGVSSSADSLLPGVPHQ